MRSWGDEMGFMTRRIATDSLQMPYRDYEPEIKRVIIKAIATAWRRALDAEGRGLLTMGEDETTTLLHLYLNEMLDVGSEGFSASVFERVSRHSPESDYTGSHLMKQPDMAFRLREIRPGTTTSQFRAFFVECKLVDSRSQMRLYDIKGIAKFEKGDYAWAMRSALMLGYSRRGLTIKGSLVPYLKKNRQLAAQPDSQLDASSELDIYRSQDDRRWSYPGSARNPGQILLHHHWLMYRGSQGLPAPRALQGRISSEMRRRLEAAAESG